MLALPREIYSVNQLGDLGWELEQIISTLRQSQIRQKVTHLTSKTEGLEMSPLLQSLFNAKYPKSNDVDGADELEDLLKEVRQVRDTAPSVHLILSGYPGLTEKLQLIDWLRAEIHSAVLCTFSVRSDIYGGIIVRTASKQYDFSFRSQLARNKKKISEIFANV
jgi:vacuolar-type H+-ATPase subunit E/Vma4